MLNKLEDLEIESIARKIPIIGSEKGAWLYDKILEINPKKILELGTANGYSGCILGSAGAELITIDTDKKILEEAKLNFRKFKINVNVIHGDAVAEVNKLTKDTSNMENFDLIYIDFMKTKYLEVLENCIKLIRKKGYIIADNITFPGCRDFKEAVLKHPELITEIVNIKDGLSFSVKNYQ